jgi:hypothetical protein
MTAQPKIVLWSAGCEMGPGFRAHWVEAQFFGRKIIASSPFAPVVEADKHSVVVFTPDGNVRTLREIESCVIRHTITRHGDWLAEVARQLCIGRSTLYASGMHELMQRNLNPTLFGAVLRTITYKGAYEAVEIGFCHYFGLELAGVHAWRDSQPETPVIAAA